MLAILQYFDLLHLAFMRNRDRVVDQFMFAHCLIDHQNPDRVRILPCDTETNLSLSDFALRFLLNRFALIGAQPELLRFKIVGTRKTNFLRLSHREVMLRQRPIRTREPDSGQQQLRQCCAWTFQA
jgi:hypothetical protein